MGKPSVPLVLKLVHKYGHGGGGQTDMNCALLHRYMQKLELVFGHKETELMADEWTDRCGS